MQRTKIKICGLTNPEDILAVQQQGVDAIGLVFYPPSPRAVTIAEAEKLAQVISPFTTLVGLFVNPDVAFVEEAIQAAGLQLLQFHGDESAEFCEQFSVPYIKAVRVKPDTNFDVLHEHYKSARGLLLDAYKKGVPGGTGEVFNWDLIPQKYRHGIILAGGLNPDNIVAAVEAIHPYAIDVSGGVESEPGKKSTALVSQLVGLVPDY